jgi:hypothetical protein
MHLTLKMDSVSRIAACPEHRASVSQSDVRGLDDLRPLGDIAFQHALEIDATGLRHLQTIGIERSFISRDCNASDMIVCQRATTGFGNPLCPMSPYQIIES